VRSLYLCLLGGAAGFVAPIQAQPQPAAPPLAFDVASVKPSDPGAKGDKGICHGIDSIVSGNQKAAAPSLGRCEVTNARLSHLVYIAWDLSSMDLIKSGPDWIARGDERFNIVARAEDPAKTTEQQLFTMLQNLVIERFQMKFHRETRDVPGFALVVAKTGAKLQESKSADAKVTSGDKFKPGQGRPVTLKARRYSMAMLVDRIARTGEHGPGIDKTGLKGTYDFTLAWDEDAGPSLSTALREQLGLRLESAKVPVSYFVIDSAQRPTAN
jgi:uncharacterized protein (TIGR03435 family)